MREKVKHEDLKVGDKLDLEHTDYGSARVDILDVKRTVKVEIASGTLKGSSGFAHGKGETFRYYLENCTFYRVPAEPETPHIELGHDHIRGRKDVAFWITDQRGKWDDCFNYRGYTLNVPVNDPRWSSTEGILYPRGSNTDFDDYITTCTFAEWVGILSLVATFNKHHADLAKKAAKPAPEEKGSVVCLCCSCGNVMTEGLDCEGDAECTSCGHPRNGHNGEPGWLEGDRLDDIREYSGAKKPPPEAKPEPRKILEDYALGSRTGTGCQNCGRHTWPGTCRKYGDLSSPSGYDIPHEKCRAAERRYKDLLAITAREEEK